MKYILLAIISITLINCDGASTKKNVNACIELGVEKTIAKAECREFDDFEKMVRRMTNEEIDRSDNLLKKAGLINDKFENYTKTKFKFNAKMDIYLNPDKLRQTDTSRQVRNRPLFAHDATIEYEGDTPQIYVKGRNWLINEEDYEFLTPSFSGIYELGVDKTKGKLFTQFLKECSKTPYCKFSVLGTINAVKPKISEASINDDWEGWIDVEDFTFNKFVKTNPKRRDIEEYVLRRVYKIYYKDHKLNTGFIKRAIFDYVYES